MTRTGRATLVLASGALMQVTAERIVYSAGTAHLFERVVTFADTGDGTVLQPEDLDCCPRTRGQVKGKTDANPLLEMDQ